jgi:PelA/Pel-15E family pectate lyase
MKTKETRMPSCTAAALLVLSMMSGAASAGIIGHMTPAQPLAESRLSSLAAAQQAAWRDYMARSSVLWAADKKALASERGSGPFPAPAPYGRPGEASMPLSRAAAWYATPEARHIADNIVSFQTPAGGWGKNVDRFGPVRLRGQHYVAEDMLLAIPQGANREPPANWTFVGTIDNDATVTELRFLARVQAQAPGAAGEAYRTSFLKGVRYLLQSQYPNGGFPQVYPLQGGYHDAVTINDDAMANVFELLGRAGARQGDYGFVPPALAAEVRNATDSALRLVLATQVVAGGVRTGWCQQYEAISLAPAGARAFEPVSLASFESARVLSMLMQLPDPGADVVAAVHAGAAWLRRVALRDVDWTAATPEAGHRLVPSPGAGPTWARYYDIASMRPVFGDRDKSIHDDVNDISLERRNGYGWYGTGPAKVLRLYDTWAKGHPPAA